MLSLLFFSVGGCIGLLAARSGAVIQQIWPGVLRTQIFVTALVVTGVAVWRVQGVSQLDDPLLVSVSLLIPFAAAMFSRGERSSGEVALESWAVSANSGYWVVPVAAAFSGTAGTMIAALVVVPTTLVNMWWVVLLRRDAPSVQRRATSWADYSPLLATVMGFTLRFVHTAPASTREILHWAGPLLAFSGAAVVAGSLLHPHNVAVRGTRQSLVRWAWLTGLRVAYCLLLLVVASSKSLRVVVVLTALSAPAFNPIQLAVLYGYRSSVVRSAIRWGWVLAPFGLLFAAFLR